MNVDLREFTYHAALGGVVEATRRLAHQIAIAGEAARAYEGGPEPDPLPADAAITACRSILREVFARYPGAPQMLGVELLPEMLSPYEKAGR